MKINKWLAMALACSFATATNADELYEFFSIECMPELRTLRVSSVAIWNIQEQIWPNAPIQDDRAKWLKANWTLHEQALQRLERKRNLYVFGQMYGMAQGDPIQCSLSGVHISIYSQKIERPDDEMKGVTRGNPRIVASWANGKEAFSTYLAPGDDLQVSEGENALTILHCKPLDDDSPAKYASTILRSARATTGSEASGQQAAPTSGTGQVCNAWDTGPCPRLPVQLDWRGKNNDHRYG